MYNGVNWTSNFIQGIRKTRPCLTGHPVHKFRHACMQEVTDGDAIAVVSNLKVVVIIIPKAMISDKEFKAFQLFYA